MAVLDTKAGDRWGCTGAVGGVRVADVAVVTDSTGCLPRPLVDSLDITVVSLYYDVRVGRGGGGAGCVSRSSTVISGGSMQNWTRRRASRRRRPPTVEDFVVVFERLLCSNIAPSSPS